MLPATDIPESDDWTPKDVAMLVAGLYDNPTQIMTDLDTQDKIATMVEEIIRATYVMAPPPSPLRNVPDMSKVAPATSAMGAYPRSFEAEPRKLADYKTLAEILNPQR